MRSDGHFVVTNRLRWVLAAVNDRRVWGSGDALDRAPGDPVPWLPVGIAETIGDICSRFSPMQLLGFDVDRWDARARVRGRDGQVLVLSLTVGAEPPHPVTGLSTTELVPRHLAPRLPMSFAGGPPLPAARGNLLVVFSGLPGAGKSTLADAVGRTLGIPVFNADWLLGALTPFGGYHIRGRQVIGAELLTTLAFRQLSLGQSALLDFPTEGQRLRSRWRSLAAHAGAAFKVVVCECPDVVLHHRRLEERDRAIPGWHDGGNWPSITRRLAAFPAWEGDALTIDTRRETEENLAAILSYLGTPRQAAGGDPAVDA